MRIERTKFNPAFVGRILGPLLATVFGMLCWQPRMTRAIGAEQCLTDPDLDPASKAVLSPVVILAKLENVVASAENANLFVATFRLQKTFKSNDLPKNHWKKKEIVTVTFYNSSLGYANSRNHGKTKPGPNKRDRRPTSRSFESGSSSICAVSVRVLRQNQRYLVYARTGADLAQGAPRTSLVAIGTPDQASSPSSRAVRKAVCQGCTKVPGVGGLKNVDVELKKKLKLQCRITGNPAPKVDWMKDGKKLKNNKRISIRTKKKFSRLEIAIVKTQDAGEYKCRVWNILGHSSISGQVRIRQNIITDDSTFKGKPCDRDQSKYCLNNGTCLFIEAVNEISCQCAEGFRGQRCESKDINTQGISRLWSYPPADATPNTSGEGTRRRKETEGTPKVEKNLFVTIIALVALITLTLFLVIVYAISRICRNYKKRHSRHTLLESSTNSQRLEESFSSSYQTKRYLSGEVESLKRDNATEINSAPPLTRQCSCQSEVTATGTASSHRSPSFRKERLKAVSSLSDVQIEMRPVGHDKRSSWSSRRSRVTYSLISSSSLDNRVEDIAKTVVKAFQQYQQTSC